MTPPGLRYAGSCAEPDAELITLVRQGKIGAYRALYERHRVAAYRQARQLTRSASDADDLVAEAFVQVLRRLLAGAGPDSAFRPYLLTAVRHAACDSARRESRITLSEDIGVDYPAALCVGFTDSVVERLERSLVARAFTGLPRRWREALWHTVIDELSPGQAAAKLALTPNGVSALTKRARTGLRAAYLQAHLAGAPVEAECRETVDRLGEWVRGILGAAERARVRAHLDGCQRCRDRARELTEVNPRERPLRSRCTATRRRIG